MRRAIGWGLVLSLIYTSLFWTTALLAEPRFVHLNRNHGLSDNTVEAIVEDRRGFLWFGTADGLNRWDGHEVVVYRHDPDDDSSLSHSFVFSLLCDQEGVLWVGTANGLNRYDSKTDSFQRFWEDGLPESIRTSTLYTIHEAQSGRLYFGGYQGLNRYDREKDRFIPYPVDPDDPSAGPTGSNTSAILEDSSGGLWIGTFDAGLSRRDPDTGRYRHYRHRPDDPGGLAHDEVKELLEDRSGRVWIATTGGLQRYDPERDAFDLFQSDPDDPYSLIDNHLDTLIEDRDGVLWIGTVGRGISLMDPETETFTHVSHDEYNANSLSGGVVRTIFEDSRGDIWIGIYTGGTNFFNRGTEPFAFFGHEPMNPRGLNHRGVTSFFEDQDDTVWVGTEDGLHRLDDDGEFTVFQHDEKDPSSLSAPPVLSILRDSYDDFWVGTYLGGVNRFDPERGTFTRLLADPEDPKRPSNPNVFALFEDSRRRLWLGTFDGANRYDRETETFLRYPYIGDDPTSVGNDIIWNFYEDREGVLWLSTPGGLSRYVEEEDNFRTYGTELGVPTTLTSVNILCLLEDRRGRFWVGTDGGIQLFDRATGDAVAFDLKDGLSSRLVFGILEADDGRLWLSTNDGLSRFDPETYAVHNFNRDDGALAAPFTRNAFLKLRSGEMLFGGSNGLTRFDPSEAATNPYRPKTVLTDFQIFNKPAPFGGPDDPAESHISEASRIVLQPDQSVFTLRFAALSFRNPQHNRYSYKLEGFQDEWIDSGRQRAATYTNLDVGTYVFRVRGANNSGLWSAQDAAIEIVVLPAFWETWWFRGLCLVFFVMMLAAAYLIRTREIRERSRVLETEIAERRLVEAEREHLIQELETKNGELERFSYTVSHDLKAPLITILGFCGMLKQDLSKGKTRRAEQDAEQIHSAAQNMGRLLDDLLNLSRAGRRVSELKPVPLVALVKETVEQVSTKIMDRGVDLRIAETMPTVAADRGRLFEVFQNLIYNAVHYLGDQEDPIIEVGAGSKGDQVLCWVRDNGIGIDPEDQERVFGLFERSATGTEGTGVGLAIVQKIVEAHGGRVWLESAGRKSAACGGGTTFFFTLPQAR